MPLAPERRSRLLEVLGEAQARGHLGPGSLDAYLDHSLGWGTVLEPQEFLDLGSGGGIPGMVLADLWGTDAALLDGSTTRAAWLQEAVHMLDLGSRVSVISERAEAAGHNAELREHFPLVVVRSFGAPAPTAECAAPFAAEGGLIAVSEPPYPDLSRWPSAPLAQLALSSLGARSFPGGSVAVLRKTGSMGAEWPRRIGIPAKRPLW